MNIKKHTIILLRRYRELVLYCFFGFFTFITDAGVFYIFSFLFELEKNALLLHICSVISTMLAITFAYVTNRRYVFKSRVKGLSGILKEIFEFYSARIFTLVIAELFMDITVIHMGFTDWIMKLAVNLIVITINYVLSKFWIFR